MDSQVTVTLTALNASISPAERVFTLSPDRLSIPIGRASKSISKGLLGATDNAWFDSPVMSRDHAELVFNVGDKTITIQDIGSMHGTYLNTAELARKSPTVLRDGDTLVFGAEVRRGPETFPACAFRVNYKVLPYKSVNTFAFPDSSDVEDEDYDFSDDDMDRYEQPSSEDGLSIESPPPKLSQHINAIDLTRDDTPIVSSSNRIDLTGEAPAERRIMNVMVSGPVDINSSMDPVSVAVYAGNDPILLDSEDEDAQFSSDSDDPSEAADSVDSSSSDDYDVVDEIEDSEDGDAEENDSQEDVPVAPTMYSPGQFGGNSMARYAQMTNENAKALSVDSSDHIKTLGAMDVDQDDDQSEFGLSEAGAEGIRALFEDNAASNNPEHGFLTHDTLSGKDNGGNLSQSHEHVKPASAQVEEEVREFNKPINEAIPSPNPKQQSADIIMFRQPSPSDAAMVKIAAPIKLFNASPVKHTNTFVSVSDLGVYDRPTLQTLGEKTGKSDFFNARAANKERFNVEMSQSFGSMSSGTKESTEHGRARGEEQLSAVTAPFTTRTSGPSITSMVDSHVSTAYGESSFQANSTANQSFDFGECFESNLDNYVLARPAIPPLPSLSLYERVRSPSPDMTSAAEYNKSKATAATTKSRSGLSITDIIEAESTVHHAKSLKRKAEDISDATEDELRIWGNNTSSTIKSQGSSEMAVLQSEAAVSSEVPEASEPAPQAPEDRPVKRFKKLFENVGYAALGGVAVGAGLFSVLVATAPDFM